MSPHLLLTGLLLVAAAAAAPLGARDATRSPVCKDIVGEKDQTFDRFSVAGKTKCRCESESEASCQPLQAYPTVAPGTPDALLAEFHRPQVSASMLQALLAYQIGLQCRSYKQQGRRCSIVWPSDGSGTPVCDCATADGAVSIKKPHFINTVSSRKTSDSFY